MVVKSCTMLRIVWLLSWYRLADERRELRLCALVSSLLFSKFALEVRLFAVKTLRASTELVSLLDQLQLWYIVCDLPKRLRLLRVQLMSMI